MAAPITWVDLGCLCICADDSIPAPIDFNCGDRHVTIPGAFTYEWHHLPPLLSWPGSMVNTLFGGGPPGGVLVTDQPYLLTRLPHDPSLADDVYCYAFSGSLTHSDIASIYGIDIGGAGLPDSIKFAYVGETTLLDGDGNPVIFDAYLSLSVCASFCGDPGCFIVCGTAIVVIKFTGVGAYMEVSRQFAACQPEGGYIYDPGFGTYGPGTPPTLCSGNIDDDTCTPFDTAFNYESTHAPFYGCTSDADANAWGDSWFTLTAHA